MFTVEELQAQFTRKKVRQVVETKGFMNPSGASAIVVDTNGHAVTVGKCIRQRWYKYHGYPSLPDDLDSLCRMQSGNWLAEGIIDAVKELGYYEDDEVPLISNTHRFSGRIDLLMRHPKYQNLIGAELKCLFTPNSINTVFGTRGFAKTAHIMQTATYASFSKKMGLDIEDWYIIYFEPSNGRMKFYQLRLIGEEEAISVDGTLQPYTVQDILDREEYWQAVMDEVDPPQRDYQLIYDKDTIARKAMAGELTKKEKELYEKGKPVVNSRRQPLGDVECRWCDYKDICWDENTKSQ